MKKGYTLLEVVISIGISLMIFSLVLNIFGLYHVLYKKSVSSGRQKIYLNEVSIFVEAKLEEGTRIKFLDNSKECFTDNKIKFVDIEKKRIDVMELDNVGNLIITYYEYINSEDNLHKLGENIVLRNIELFQVDIRGGVMYLTVKNRKGEKIEKCLGIRREL